MASGSRWLPPSRTCRRRQCDPCRHAPLGKHVTEGQHGGDISEFGCAGIPAGGGDLVFADAKAAFVDARNERMGLRVAEGGLCFGEREGGEVFPLIERHVGGIVVLTPARFCRSLRRRRRSGCLRRNRAIGAGRWRREHPRLRLRADDQEKASTALFMGGRFCSCAAGLTRPVR